MVCFDGITKGGIHFRIWGFCFVACILGGCVFIEENRVLRHVGGNVGHVEGSGWGLKDK